MNRHVWLQRRWAWLALTMLVFAADVRGDASALDALARLVGQWHIDAKWLGNNQPLKARIGFEWGPGKKFIISRTFVTPNDGSAEYERYPEGFGVADGKLVDHLFGHGGKTQQREFQVGGK